MVLHHRVTSIEVYFIVRHLQGHTAFQMEGVLDAFAPRVEAVEPWGTDAPSSVFAKVHLCENVLSLQVRL